MIGNENKRKINEILSNKTNPIHHHVRIAPIHGHRPNEWEYWAVVACGVGIGVVEYFNGKREGNGGK